MYELIQYQFFEVHSNIRWDFLYSKLKIVFSTLAAVSWVSLRWKQRNSSPTFHTSKSNFFLSGRVLKHRCFKYNRVFGPSKHFLQLSPEQDLLLSRKGRTCVWERVTVSWVGESWTVYFMVKTASKNIIIYLNIIILDGELELLDCSVLKKIRLGLRNTTLRSGKILIWDE